MFSRRLAELRYRQIPRFYPEINGEKDRLNSPSYFCRVLGLRNQFFQKFEFNGLIGEISPSELMRLKKLFVNDLIATITGVEEEHIEWLLNHIEIRKDQTTKGKRSEAVEIDEFGNEIILENYQRSGRESSEIS